MSTAGVRSSGPFPDLALADLDGRPCFLAEAWRDGEALFLIGHPVRLEPDPYPLARALDLGVVPALVLVDREGRIDRVSVGFRRADLEAFAARLGVAGTLFTPEDGAPEFRPG